MIWRLYTANTGKMSKVLTEEKMERRINSDMDPEMLYKLKVMITQMFDYDNQRLEVQILFFYISTPIMVLKFLRQFKIKDLKFFFQILI